jgi:hypothetical protein
LEEVVLELFLLQGVPELEPCQAAKEVVDLHFLDVKGAGHDRQINVINISPRRAGSDL